MRNKSIPIYQLQGVMANIVRKIRGGFQVETVVQVCQTDLDNISNHTRTVDNAP